MEANGQPLLPLTAYKENSFREKRGPKNARLLDGVVAVGLVVRVLEHVGVVTFNNLLYQIEILVDISHENGTVGDHVINLRTCIRYRHHQHVRGIKETNRTQKNIQVARTPALRSQTFLRPTLLRACGSVHPRQACP